MIDNTPCIDFFEHFIPLCNHTHVWEAIRIGEDDGEVPEDFTPPLNALFQRFSPKVNLGFIKQYSTNIQMEPRATDNAWPSDLPKINHELAYCCHWSHYYTDKLFERRPYDIKGSRQYTLMATSAIVLLFDAVEPGSTTFDYRQYAHLSFAGLLTDPVTRKHLCTFITWCLDYKAYMCSVRHSPSHHVSCSEVALNLLARCLLSVGTDVETFNRLLSSLINSAAAPAGITTPHISDTYEYDSSEVCEGLEWIRYPAWKRAFELASEQHPKQADALYALRAAVSF